MARGRSIKNKQISPELLAVIVDGTGTAALSGLNANDVTLTDNGTGDYTITFDEPFKCADTEVVAVATPVTANVRTNVSTVAKTAVKILTKSDSSVAAVLEVDAALKLHAHLAGKDGNDITIEFADAVSAGSEAVASVSDAGVIVVNIEDGVSTATQVHAALMADSVLAHEARNFIASEVLVGATAINAAAAANLAGGLDSGDAIDADFHVLIMGSNAADRIG